MPRPTYPKFAPSPLSKALPLLIDIYVDTRFHREAGESLKRLFYASGISGLHKGLALVGPSGSGKNAAVRNVERWLRQELGWTDDELSPLPIVLLAASSTPKALLRGLLDAAGDPFSGTGSQYELEMRLKAVAKDSKVLGFALDEFHHTYEHKTPRERADMEKVLKNVVNIVEKPIVAMGLDGIETVLDSSRELKRRFARRVFLDDPLVSSKEDLTDLRKVLLAMKEVLPCDTACDLDSKAMLLRLLLASEGSFGNVVNTVHRACEVGAQQGAGQLTIAHFCAAYRESAPRDKRADEDNPFVRPLEVVTALVAQLRPAGLRRTQ